MRHFRAVQQLPLMMAAPETKQNHPYYILLLILLLAPPYSEVPLQSVCSE